MNKKILILRNPFFNLLIKLGFTDILLDFYWGTNSKKEWQKIKETGFISKPKSLWFEPTMRCNLNCQFCHQNVRRKMKNKELTTAQIKMLLTNIKKMNIDHMAMIGGEIFIRKDIFEIFNIIEKLNINVKIGTNGILLNENIINKLKKYSCIESISISIDGPEKIHNQLRNCSFAFQKAVNALKKISKQDFISVIYSVLLPENFDTSDYLINMAKELNVDRITFMPEMFYSKKDKEISRKIINLKPGEKLFVEQKDEKNLSKYTETVIATLNKIKKIRKKKGFFVPIYPRMANKYAKDFFMNKLYKKRTLICKHFHSVTVIENGDILICPFIHKKLGNILKDDIEKIWNSEKTKKLRKNILRSNLLPICRKCCSADYL